MGAEGHDSDEDVSNGMENAELLQEHAAKYVPTQCVALTNMQLCTVRIRAMILCIKCQTSAQLQRERERGLAILPQVLGHAQKIMVL